MLSILNIAASGLSAASARLAVTAGNIANADSAGYHARRVTAAPATGGGVRVDSVALDSSAAPLGLDGNRGSTVDLARESVDLIRAKHQYTANAKLVKAGDRMLGTLLDVLAK